MLAAHRVDACLIAGVDSLLNRTDVDRLHDAGLIHEPGNPQGIIPGEGAACLLVRRAGEATSGALARIIGLGQAHESKTVLGGSFAIGEGMCRALKSALADAGRREPQLSLRVSDMNGERYHAWDSMISTARFYRTRRERVDQIYPAAATGDLGAAAGALVVVIAAVNLYGGKAPGPLTMCEASSDEGVRAACVLEAVAASADALNARESALSVRDDIATLPDVVTRHADDAAFLWAQREHGIERRDFTLEDLLIEESRLDAHLDGLLAAGGAAWRSLRGKLDEREVGAAFALAWVALASRDAARLCTLFELTDSSAAPSREIVSAFGWSAPACLQQPVKHLLGSSSPALRATGIAACAMHRVVPGDALRKAARDKNAGLRARALKAIAELGWRSGLPACIAALSDENPLCRFWAACACLLFGEQSAALDVLLSLSRTEGPLRGRALRLMSATLPVAEARSAVRAANVMPLSERDKIEAVGLIGDPALIDWLITKMTDIRLARISGEALMRITGMDIGRSGLQAADAPSDDSPSDSADDEKVHLDRDSQLPWPDAQRVGEWWHRHKNGLRPGVRYFCGTPVSVEQCRIVLRSGKQGMRGVAALHLALRDPAQGWFSIKAPARRQLSLLEASSRS
jgi:uncharacterized protein (TIGR02270 family)